MTKHINRNIARFQNAGLSSRAATDKALALEGLPKLGVAKPASTLRSVTQDRRANRPAPQTRAQVRAQSRAAATQKPIVGSAGRLKKASKPVVAPKRNLPRASSSSMRRASQLNTP